MANTYSSLYYHIVFSTKNRVRHINTEFEEKIWAYIGGVARKHGVTALQVGGVDDHIHALILARAPVAPSEITRWLKGDSSKWIHQEFPRLSDFGWQDGYSVFSVSRSQIAPVISYIQKQREHHRRKTFQEEYRELLTVHGVEYDERYVWG